MPGLTMPRVVLPGDPVPDVDLDYLLVHAHPDDEALDFGGLLARLDREGLRGAVVILTDGNAGLDQYPWRDTGSEYPPYDLADHALSEVRVLEAREAIGWLGADLYIRGGLVNHPYGSVVEAMQPEDVIEIWGGRDTLVAWIAYLIERLRPELLLSPDGPGPAYEHFEHEATGILVALARERVESRGSSPIAMHLVSVDPLQLEGYSGLVRFSPWVAPPAEAPPRLRQLLALRAHRTQRDATVIGVETRMALWYEYYLVRARDDQSEASALLSSLLEELTVDRGATAP